MRQYGKERTKTRVAGHQECGVCHPATPRKVGRAKARRAGRDACGWCGGKIVEDPAGGWPYCEDCKGV